MTGANKPVLTLIQLDADEILAVRENLQSASRLSDGPPARRIPEGLCSEIDQLLRLLEEEVRRAQEPRDKDHVPDS